MDKLILKLLVGSLRSGNGLNGYCQNLLVGPLQKVDGVGVWIARLTSTADLHFEGESNVLGINLLGKSVPLLVDNPISQAVRKRQFCSASELPEAWVDGIELPTGLVFSAFPIQGDLIVRGAMMIGHAGRKDYKEFILDIYEILEAVTSLSFDLGKLSGLRTNGKNNNHESSDLTSRQLKVLTCIRDGLTNYQIARVLNVSESTVKQETIRIYRYLDTNNRLHAVELALERGIIRPESDAVITSSRGMPSS
jgi:DNA-binding CsgD family transcriptional regulator